MCAANSEQVFGSAGCAILLQEGGCVARAWRPSMCWPCWTPCDCVEACQEKNRKLISCCGNREDEKLKPASLYVTRNALASMKQGCAGTDHLSITDDMLLWTPAEARRYFESAGQQRPNPDELAGRLPDDKAAATSNGTVGLEMQR